jgi:phosphoribosylaminoimidazolecarboxamide formyltransferase/IMP cyclohydrolase
VADDITTAYVRAHECDPVSAFGGIVAVNRPVTVAMAEALAPVFTEVVVAPGFDEGALGVLQAKKNLRILQAAPPHVPPFSLRTLDGGFLVQDADAVAVDRAAWRVVTPKAPTDEQWADLELAWRVVARVTSNAIVLVKDGQAVGIGCGQQNRRDAGRLACEKADGRAAGGVYASDAFFPFPDGLDGAVDAGAAVVVQPGGSIRDDEVIARADEVGLAMVLTGERHFRH